MGEGGRREGGREKEGGRREEGKEGGRVGGREEGGNKGEGGGREEGREEEGGMEEGRKGGRQEEIFSPTVCSIKLTHTDLLVELAPPTSPPATIKTHNHYYTAAPLTATGSPTHYCRSFHPLPLTAPPTPIGTTLTIATNSHHPLSQAAPPTTTHSPTHHYSQLHPLLPNSFTKQPHPLLQLTTSTPTV